MVQESNIVWDGKVPLHTAKDGAAVYKLLRPLARLEDVEVIWALPLDSALQLLIPGPEVVARGTVGSCDATMSRCFRLAVQLDAAGLIVAHQHTNGLITATAEDRAFTQRLVLAGAVLGCPLLDHVIIGSKGYYSFKEHKLI